jgi:hypothetical protein
MVAYTLHIVDSSDGCVFLGRILCITELTIVGAGVWGSECLFWSADSTSDQELLV